MTKLNQLIEYEVEPEEEVNKRKAKLEEAKPVFERLQYEGW